MAKQNTTNFHLPRWNELPNLDLYLDQTVTLLETYLQNYIGNKDEKIITAYAEEIAEMAVNEIQGKK